jgi:tetratricopeptide (TPR) repeat protein
MSIKRIIASGLAALGLGGCALYSDVAITPMQVSPAQIDRGVDLQSMLRKADYLRAVELTSSVEAKQRPSVAELAALGKAELVSGRYDSARRHLREAIEMEPFRETAANIAWSLSQLEYLSNNYDSSLEWAQYATEHGLNIRTWHLQFLEAMASKNVYQISGAQTTEVQLKATKPDVPRIDLRVNGSREINAVIDSGAVISIVSQRLADELKLKKIGEFHGTFFGLLGEPIDVQFAILEQLQLGTMSIGTVPVAIMPDDKMRFVVSGKHEYKIDFLLGANFLKEFRTDLDFPRESVTFHHLSAAERRPAEDQNLFIEGFRPFVRGLVNRRGWFVFIFDTGSEVTFINQQQLASLPITQLTPKAHSAMLQGLGGSKKRGEKLDNVEIGIDRWAGTFNTVPMYFSDEKEHAAGILGENFLKNFRVILDFGRMRVDLIHPGEAPRITTTSSFMTAGARGSS